jgi:hypothetical protein
MEKLYSYLIPNFPLGNVFANGFNDSRTFKSWIGASTLRGRISAFPLKGISSVKGSGVNFDEDFIVFDLRVFNLLELKNFRFTWCCYYN